MKPYANSDTPTPSYPIAAQVRLIDGTFAQVCGQCWDGTSWAYKVEWVYNGTLSWAYLADYQLAPG